MHLILGIVGGVLGIGGIGAALAFFLVPGASAVFAALFKAGLEFLSGVLTWAAEHWKVVLPCALAIAALAYILILRGERSSRDVTIAAQGVLIGKVKAEVDRGINGKSNPADSPFYIHRFVDNVRTLDAALTRQSAALRVSAASSDSHNAASHAAAIAPPTPVQKKREETRQQIVDPKSGGLNADEWSQL